MSLIKHIDNKNNFSLFDFDSLNVDSLTPYTKVDGHIFKREDLFQPFPDIPINGSKVRQTLKLFYENYNYIKSVCHGNIVIACSVHSPHMLITTRVAKEFGFKTLVALGGPLTTEEAINNHPFVNMSYKLGAEIRVVAGTGFTSTIYGKLKKTDNTKRFAIKFPENSKTNPKAILGSISRQVKNIPHGIDTIVVPVGSGVTMAGILLGMRKYNIVNVKVVGIQVAGFDRRKDIDIMLGYKGVYNFIEDLSFPYSKRFDYTFKESTNLELDSLYESKAYRYIKNFPYAFPKNETLFWIIGNSNLLLKEYSKDVNN